MPVPYVDRRAAELLFRHGVIALLRDEGLLGQERIELLMSWQANTGFSVHNAVTVEPEEPAAGGLAYRPVAVTYHRSFGDCGRARASYDARAEKGIHYPSTCARC